MRQPSDTAPEWQCPACGIAIEKFRLYQEQEASIARAIAEAPPPLPRLPLSVRVTNAMPESLTAGVFAWCWLFPMAWRPTLAMELGTVMLMEFFVMHSSVFFVVLMGREGSVGVGRLAPLLLMLMFYMPVAGLFGYFNGGWWPVLAFYWLLLSQSTSVLTGRYSSALEAKRQRFYWGAATSFYVLGLVVLIFVSLPRLGFGEVVVPWSAWMIPPQTVMGWGVVTFGGTALTKLLEKPEWIAAQE